MAISLNNHESRIKALESGGSSTWTKGTGTNCFWTQEKTTGLIIQFGWTGNDRGDSWKTITLPKAYKNTNYTALYSLASGGSGGQEYNSFGATGKTTTGFKFKIQAVETASFTWLAIGYLISNRILNYAYACKNLLFTPLRTIGGVK